MAKSTYRVYVIELSKRIFTENKRFREANPQYNGVLECLYVGMTSKTPEGRFEQHKSRLLSHKGRDISAAMVRQYGMYLRPSLYHHLDQNMTRDEAIKSEESLARALKRKRYAVWWN